MKNLRVLLVFALLAFGSAAMAQNGRSFYNSPYKTRNSGSFDKSTGLLTFSYGFPNVPVRGYSYAGFGGPDRLGFGPVYVKYEHGLLDEVGIGGQAAFAVGKVDYGADEANITAFHFAVLGYYHFNKLIPIKVLDVYAGTGLAFRSRAVNWDNDADLDDSSTRVYVPFKVGARWYFKPRLGLYLEAGYDDMSDVNLGITLRM
ncbi:MAG: porin family protein [Bacteroidia bacterium]|nr:porin family protein [Bacteroidia bacterium]